VASDRRFPPHHPLLSHLQQIKTILSQQVNRMRNVWNVLYIAVLEALAVERFE
jgi:hypothetical protein